MLGQRVMNSPRLSIYTLNATGPPEAPTCRTSASGPTRTGSPTRPSGFKANVASRLLVNFNLRFNLGDKGLADRVAPLIGIEWSF